jgi:hypothetical protein
MDPVICLRHQQIAKFAQLRTIIDKYVANIGIADTNNINKEQKLYSLPKRYSKIRFSFPPKFHDKSTSWKTVYDLKSLLLFQVR